MYNKKVVYINARFLTQKITGVQRFAIEISKYLKESFSDIKVCFVAPKNIIDKDLAKKLDVKIIGKLTGNLWEQYELPSYLNQHGKPLLINLCNSAPILYENKISTIHDLAFTLDKEWFDWKFRLWYNFLIPRVVKSSHKILTVSNSMKFELCKYFNLEETDIGVVYNSTSFNLQMEEKNFDDSFVLLTVGSLDPRKNLKVLLDVFIEFQKELKDVRLQVIGGLNKNFNKLEIRIIPENVKFLGRLTDDQLIDKYKKSSAYISVSLYEGFGIPNLEAMSFGLPLIVSDIPVHREIGQDIPVYINPKSTKEIKNAILSIKKSSHLKEISRKAFERSTEFTWSKSANLVSNYINEFN